MWKNLLNKVKGKITDLKLKKKDKEAVKEKVSTEIIKTKEKIRSKKLDEKEYPNRFLKFYHLHQTKLNKARRKGYSYKKKEGICVRCKQKSLPKIVFCEYHQQKQQTYNQRSRHQST